MGRAGLLARLEQALTADLGVLLTGPNGIGKSSVLDAVAASARTRGEAVLRVCGVEAERWIAGTAAGDLVDQVPAGLLTTLSPAERAALRGDPLRDPATGGRAWCTLLRIWAGQTPVLLLVDDAQWVDSTSADLLGFAVRRLAGRGVHVVVAGRWAAEPRTIPVLPSPSTWLEVPALSADELATLLDLHGLPARTASKIHLDSAGNPFLALALAGAFVDHSPEGQRPEPLPPSISGLIRSRMGTVSRDVRETLLLCALANAPTLQLLLRAGRVDAAEHLRAAEQAGLVVTENGLIRFTPASAARVVAAQATGSRRTEVHTLLADVVTCDAQRERHRALATAHPDGPFARSLAAAAGVALRRGARDLASELYVLAADHAPGDHAQERLQWLVAAAEVGSMAGQDDIVHRATDAVLAADSAPSHRVAVRLALVQLASQGAVHMQETLAAARQDAADDPGLLATVRLWQSGVAAMAGHPAEALREADAVIELSQRVGDTSTEAMAWSVSALTARQLGRDDHADRLARGLALPHPQMDGWLHLTPRFRAARLALTEDRLDEARRDLLGMLALVERGAPEELVGVMGALTEVAARAGRCREALDYAQRSIRVSADAGLSPGPSWYFGAVAELAGGTLEKGIAYAGRGVVASEQEGDRIYLRHNLHALGHAQRRLGQAPEAAATLRRVQALENESGICDPANLRWNSDLVAALAASGRTGEAQQALDEARTAVRVRGAGIAVGAQLDRSGALLLAAAGEPAAALEALAAAALTFEALGEPIERGHCLLVQAQVERQRRRSSAARASLNAAQGLFERAAARPWVDQCTRALSQLDGSAAESRPVAGTGPDPSGLTGSDGSAVTELTATESRIAALVADGASNREIAVQLYLSVKTVEATLTRVYRKLGVRSRTQLSRRLASAR